MSSSVHQFIVYSEQHRALHVFVTVSIEVSIEGGNKSAMTGTNRSVARVDFWLFCVKGVCVHHQQVPLTMLHGTLAASLLKMHLGQHTSDFLQQNRPTLCCYLPTLSMKRMPSTCPPFSHTPQHVCLG